MKIKVFTLVAVLAVLVVAGCGGKDNGKDSGGMSGMSGMSDSSSASVGNGADRAFVSQMIPHHKSAIEMARIAQQRGQSQFVKTLADNIVRTQTAEISTLKAEDKKLAAAGIKKGDMQMSMDDMGMSMGSGMLKTAKPFDPAFLKMMLPHHKGAVKMAQMELDMGKSAKLKSVARDIISAQNKEITDMNKALAKS